MAKAILLIVLFGLLYSCKTETSKSQAIRVDMLKSVDPHNIEDVIDSIKVILLETTDQSLIKQAGIIKTEANDWYVYGYDDSPIKRFSQDGTFVTELGKKGQGPGEFIQISDFFVNKDTINLFAWSGNRKWIRMRNDNTFLYETEMSFPFNDAYRVNDNRYLFHVGNGSVSKEVSHYLYAIDKNYRIKEKRYPKIEPYDIPYEPFNQRFCGESEGHVLYRRDYNDTIYSINAASTSLHIIPKYWLDFGDVWFSKSFLKDFYSKYFMDIHREFNKRGYPKFMVFSESPNHLMVNFTRQEDKKDVTYLTLYAKGSGKAYNFEAKKGSLASLLARLQGYNGRYFYSFIEASDFLEVASQLKTEKTLYHDIKRASKHLQETDNPVLVLFKFKSNIQK